MTDLDDIRIRRLDAFSAQGDVTTRERLTAMADATTLDDLLFLRRIRDGLDEDTELLLQHYEDLSREYASGIRCAVCGMTGKQSRAIGSDCRVDC